MLTRNRRSYAISLATLAICLFQLRPSFGTQVSDAELKQRYEAAQQALRQHDLERGRVLFEQVLAESSWQLSRLYRSVGRFPEAVARLEEVEKLEPQNDEIKRELTLARAGTEPHAHTSNPPQERQGLIAEDAGIISLERMYTQVLANSHNGLGLIDAQQNRFEDAVVQFQNLLALDPQTPDAHYYLGKIDLDSGKLPAAEAEFRAEIEGHSQNPKARYSLAYVLLEEEKRDEAVGLLESLVKDVPGYAQPHYSLGKTLVEEDELERGIAELETATRLDPSKTYSHYELARAYQKAGRTLDAQREFERVRQLAESENVR